MNKIGRLLKVEESCELFSRQICSKRHLLHGKRSPRPALQFIDARSLQWRLSFHFFCLEKIKLLVFARLNENVSEFLTGAVYIVNIISEYHYLLG